MEMDATLYCLIFTNFMPIINFNTFPNARIPKFLLHLSSVAKYSLNVPFFFVCSNQFTNQYDDGQMARFNVTQNVDSSEAAN